MSGIFWLASFPKSGNTWVRGFLANLTSDQDGPVDINAFYTGSIASSRNWIERALGIDISELSHEEIDRLRPNAYRWIAENEVSKYHKIHDAYRYLPSGDPLIPRDSTRGAVYVVRHPLDVAISYAYYFDMSFNQSATALCDPDNGFCRSVKGSSSQLRQILSTWSNHVESWLDAEIPKKIVRYEDMIENPVDVFSSIAGFLEIEVPRQEVENALEQCHFDLLRQQEKEVGFEEKSSLAKSFFRKGMVGEWQETLTNEQVEKILAANRRGMQRMGYLDDQGHPVIYRPDYSA